MGVIVDLQRICCVIMNFYRFISVNSYAALLKKKKHIMHQKNKMQEQSQRSRSGCIVKQIKTEAWNKSKPKRVHIHTHIYIHIHKVFSTDDDDTDEVFCSETSLSLILGHKKLSSVQADFSCLIPSC